MSMYLFFKRSVRLALMATTAVASLLHGTAVTAATLSFSSGDVSITGTPTGNVQLFEFDIDLVGVPGLGNNSNPAIVTVDYAVSGSLDAGNPSGFPAFALRSEDINGGVNPLTGAQFYGNGGSLEFVVEAGANLSDGLQVSELGFLPAQAFPSPVDAVNAVFILNAREDGTGRYHPPLVILRSDGTGQILNSNNTGVNGQTGRDIVAQDGLTFGDEYITTFSFDPAQLTLVAPVPLPAGMLLYSCSLLAFVWLRQRRESLSSN